MAEINSLINLVELKDLVLKFLESKDILSDIKNIYDFYTENSAKNKEIEPIIFTLKINYQEIVGKELIHFITRETDWFLKTVQEIIHYLVKSYFEQESGSNFDISCDEIICNFHFYELPLDLYKFSLRHSHIICSLSTFRCIIQRTDPKIKYIRQSSWKCVHCFNGPIIIVRNRAITHKPPKCKRCLKPCIEISDKRITSDFCAVHVYESDYLLKNKDCFLTRTLELRLFDDLCQELKIGQEYIVIGKYEVLSRFYNVYSISLA